MRHRYRPRVGGSRDGPCDVRPLNTGAEVEVGGGGGEEEGGG